MRTAALGVLLVLSLGLAPVHGQSPADSTYTVQSGDTLFSIAQEHGVSVRALKAWNDLADASALQVGQSLRVRPPEAEAPDAPKPPDDTAAPPPPANGPNSPEEPAATPDPSPADTASYGTYTTEPGDTFVNLALRLGTTADTLAALNDDLDSLTAGQTLRLPRRFGPSTHVVSSGETLYSIAGQYGASVRALQSINDLDTTALQPGQRLRLPASTASGVPPSGEWAAPDTTGPVAIYPDPFRGRLTASGTPYDPEEKVVSHPSLPLGSVVHLSTGDQARETFARVIDRGPVADALLLDVSAAVAEGLNVTAEQDTVALRVVWVGPPPN
jgi:LysM repeat protein